MNYFLEVKKHALIFFCSFLTFFFNLIIISKIFNNFKTKRRYG